MIEYEERYLQFIKRCGVGSRDVVGDSRKAYVGYLNCVCRHLDMDITPETVHGSSDVDGIRRRLRGRLAPKTVVNYCVALNRYVEMVEQEGLWESSP